MSEFIALMLKPFIACLVLTGIHAYLGLHVVRRGVIFVDLALAQVAAFGATLGFLMNFELHSTQSYLISLAVTLVAAAIFSFFSRDEGEIPQEAYIGIVYAIAAAGAILVLNFAPAGGEELKNLMVGHLLFVEWTEIVKILGIYSAVGLLHWLFRRKFFEISENPRAAEASGANIRAWDFLFYATFGLVVTSSVELAGVLLVFSFLIVPAVCGILIGGSVGARLVIGWCVGFVVSCVGVSTSYLVDLPTGATIVCTFGLALVVCGILRRSGLVVKG